MAQDALFAFWFLLPAAAANAAPIFAAAVPLLNRFDAPIDGGMTFRGQPLFGDHKTWRGLAAGIIAAVVILGLQQWLAATTTWGAFASGPVDYAALPLFLLGPLFALGALGGDAAESFLKRQRKLRPGTAWVPFDQLDYIIGATAISCFFVILNFQQYAWIFIIWFTLHIIASYLGYKLRLKDDPI